ncbi:hypothetical protein [Cupriavidus pinatubonensis]|uniref:Uncharacterized protein n=1 Tax=Cupriavidus pinatubonensis TaxID=248026 RepID=A0ABM8XGJ6_9BURK|nr:hypothetical protein [Cupriavidus pinatubonensis]CAG9179288.1 hypothetical protein LMG23994_04118 [Cupriavidus pinatubonensis]
MPEFEGYKIVYEVIALPKGKWSILVEIIRRLDGEALAPRHNPFPNHPFDTKLEALDQVNQYIETVLAEAESEGKQRRIA